MNVVLEAGVAIYVAMAVALTVWIGIFVYLWRLDAQARRLRDLAKREIAREHEPSTRATVTRVREHEPLEKEELS